MARKTGVQHARDFRTPLVVGATLSVALAVVADLSLALIQRLMTPWRTA